MHPPASPSTIALVGLPGAGKSTVAGLLGARLGDRHADLDARIEARAGTPIAELFAARGEAAFRELESAELAAAIREGVRVIACGGGIVETQAARLLLLERCRTVWLEVDVAEALRRMGDSRASRPLLAASAAPEGLEWLKARRTVSYAEVAWLRVTTDGLTPQEVAERIARAVEDGSSGGMA